jgi:non-ribosomal peptide synthetase-like protein
MRIHDLFLSAAARWPDAVAIDVPGTGERPRQTTTYRQLSAVAAQLAAHLRPLVDRERLVAVLLPRDSHHLYAGQLAVLQVGAAHVCLDAAFPDAHFAHVLRDADVAAVLTHRAAVARCVAAGVAPERVFAVEELLLSLPAVPHAPVDPAWLTPESLAYAIYTSGTTGAPKGVLLEHRGIVHLIQSGIARFAIQPGDRIAQGSSPAYDSSVEETWLALAAGATVVPLDDEVVRLGPDLVPWLRREGITILCPPPTLLRAMACDDPARELPALRLCYAGGEAMPQDLADRWGAALWLENGYGPTECTVTVVRGRLHPGEPVTIGTPVPGHTAWLLDDHQTPVPAGTPGELCIAGPGLARGYLGKASLTAERFPILPGIGRVYRTGDLCRQGDDGRLHYLGRMDAQVKLRGHRIELEAIEAALANCDGIRAAACCVQQERGADLLCAFLVLDDPSRAPTAAALRAALLVTLPPYMVPSRFAVTASLPQSIGGKLDRRSLAARTLPPEPNAVDSRGEAPRSEHERRLAAAFATCLPGVAAVARDDDFFALGGDSLRAAQLISQLRRDPAYAHLAVRDVYLARTVAGLAARIDRPTDAPVASASEQRSVQRPGLPQILWFTLGQTAWLLLLLLIGSCVAWLLSFRLLPWLLTDLGFYTTALLTPVLAALLVLAHLLVAVWLTAVVKFSLIGRYQPGRVPVWGTFHLRHWIVVQTARLIPWDLLAGTVFLGMVLRVLGARIGARVSIGPDVDFALGGWDLLAIGDDATLQREAHAAPVELDAGHWVIGTVRIGARSTLATRAGMGPGSSLGDDASLTPLSFLASGMAVPAGEQWDGVPARRVGLAAPPPPIDVPGAALAPWAHGALLLGSRLAAWPILLLALGSLAIAATSGIDGVACLQWLYGSGPLADGYAVALVAALSVAGLVLTLILQGLLLRWTPHVPPGTHSRWSLHQLRLQLRNRALESAGTWLSGTLFWPIWLRLAGMHVGEGAEVSTIVDVLPEHTTIGAWSFLADGIYLGAPEQRAGAVTVRPTVLGARTFLGNHVVVPTGAHLPDDLLLGVSTVADAKTMGASSSWFGHPPFLLPRREIVTADRRLTHEPSLLRRVNRLCWEALRLFLPAGIAVLWLAWFDLVGDGYQRDDWWWPPLVLVPLATLAAGAALALAILLAKWLLLGRVRPGQHALWSCWASRWDFHYVLWNRWGRALLSQLEGTLWLPIYLRAMGMQIGRRVVLGHGFAQVVDPDMIRIDDGATVHTMFQAHSFEDRVLKIDRVHIGADATVARGTVALYGASIGAGAHVAAHGVVMKHEHLLPGRAYAGVPTAAVPASIPPSMAVMPAPTHDGRERALDVARGLAVVGMILLHLVPGDMPLLGTLHGVPAALFVLLAGMSWTLQVARRQGSTGLRRYTLRRSISLGIAGMLFWRLWWPTDVLLPFALMLPLVVLLVRRGVGAVLIAIGMLLLLTPVLAGWLGEYVAIDCLDDGMHLANTSFGWHTLRYFVFDGSYPLVPWAALALLGALLVLRDDGTARQGRLVCLLALPMAVAVASWNGWAVAVGAVAPELELFFGSTWQPTTLPFVLQVGAVATTLVGGLQWWQRARGLPHATALLAALGRTSLTHYVLHILLVFAPLRLWWPDEDWSLAIGLGAAIGYLAVALPLTVRWLRRRRQGPLEALWAWASGR